MQDRDAGHVVLGLHQYYASWLRFRKEDTPGGFLIQTLSSVLIAMTTLTFPELISFHVVISPSF